MYVCIVFEKMVQKEKEEVNTALLLSLAESKNKRKVKNEMLNSKWL